MGDAERDAELAVEAANEEWIRQGADAEEAEANASAWAEATIAEAGAVFNAECLRDLAAFCDEMTKEGTR